MQFGRGPSPPFKGLYVRPDLRMGFIIGIEAIREAWTVVAIKTNMQINRVYAAFRGPLRRVKRVPAKQLCARFDRRKKQNHRSAAPRIHRAKESYPHRPTL